MMIISRKITVYIRMKVYKNGTILLTGETNSAFLVHKKVETNTRGYNIMKNCNELTPFPIDTKLMF